MKNKQEKSKIAILSAVLIALVAVLIAVFYVNLDSITGFTIQENTAEITSKAVQEAQEVESLEETFPKWENPVTFGFSENCTGPEPDRMREAFQIISDITDNNLVFTEVAQNSKIRVDCYEDKVVEADLERDRTVITHGMARPFISGNEIISARIQIWGVSEDRYPKSCQWYPQLELHEIFHVLGFEHTDDPRSIMHPFLGSCLYREGYTAQDKIDEDIRIKLKEIYSPR